MAAPLRYPLGQLNETSDYLQIGIVKYNPIGTPQNSGVPVTVGSNDNVRSGGYYNFQTGTYVKGQKSTSQTIVDYGSPIRGSGQLKNKNKNILGSIILPIPSNIQDGNSVTFGPGNLDGLTASVLEYATNMIGKGKGITSLSDAGTLITDALRGGTNLLTGDALEYFTRNIAAAAANIPFGGNLTASQLLARQTGQILNPNMELLFEGVTLRSFKFSFKLTPRGPAEAQSVKNIIRILKKNMTPQADGIFLQTPNIFELTYKKGSNDHPFLHKFKQCALTDMSVNYTGEGVYATYGGSDKDGGGTPVSMIMDLGFKELEPIYSGDYEDSDTSVGF
jgi:hypothetical protein